MGGAHINQCRMRGGNLGAFLNSTGLFARAKRTPMALGVLQCLT